MATKRPKVSRIALTLTGEPLAAVRDLAGAMDKPIATVIADMVRESAPIMRDLAKVLRQVRAGRLAAARKGLAHMVGELDAVQTKELFDRS